MKITTSTEIDGKETCKETKYVCDGCKKESTDSYFNDESMLLSYKHDTRYRDYTGITVGGNVNKKELLLCNSCSAKILNTISELGKE